MTRKIVAYTCLLVLALVLAYGWFGPRRHAVATGKANREVGDRILFSAVVQRLQRGESYYAAMRTELQAGNYPTASVFNWRTPLHLSILSVLTVTGSRVILGAIAIAAVALLIPAYPSARATIMAVGVPTIASTILVELADAWAGALIALSLGAYVRQRWLVAAICGVLAVFIREQAAIYVVCCAVIAMWSRRKTESLVWALGGALYLGYYAWHAEQVLAAIPPDARSHGASWVQWGGLPFIFRTVECYGWALFAPSIVVPPVVASGLAGTVSKQMPVHARVALIAYVVAFGVVGLPINRYWGLVTVPLWGLGVLHAVGGFHRLRSWLSRPSPELLRAQPSVVVCPIRRRG
jgi:hypothetical protein